MAFLCPVRIRRKKIKEGDKLGTSSIGRITGSASIETLVRVGIEKKNGFQPNSKMVVLHDFNPCVDDELEVKRGQVVNILYQENDWVYVIAENNSEGFIPHSYCASINSQIADLASNVKKKLPRNGLDQDLENHIQPDPDSYFPNFSLTTNTFLKDPLGRYLVLYTFIARDENDVSVERGEIVTVLNKEDSDWFWIVRLDGQEGFIPSAFICSIDMLQDHSQNSQAPSTNLVNMNPTNHISCINHNYNNSVNSGTGTNSNQFNGNQENDSRFYGTELVMLYDYKAQASDDLSVRRGDWIHANLSNQTVDGWLWAYAPKSRKYGFIPKAYARPPAMTSL